MASLARQGGRLICCRGSLNEAREDFRLANVLLVQSLRHSWLLRAAFPPTRPYRRPVALSLASRRAVSLVGAQEHSFQGSRSPNGPICSPGPKLCFIWSLNQLLIWASCLHQLEDIQSACFLQECSIDLVQITLFEGPGNTHAVSCSNRLGQLD